MERGEREGRSNWREEREWKEERMERGEGTWGESGGKGRENEE